MNETRKSHRIPKRTQGLLQIVNHSFPIMIRNISATGLCASIRANIPIGTRCYITIDTSTLFFPAIIVRCSNNEIGIAFYSLTVEHKKLLQNL